jgi:hypothetical protein
VLPSDQATVNLRSLRDVCELVSETVGQVRTGALDPRVANAVGYLCTVLIRALELSRLEERIAALERGRRPVDDAGESPFERRFQIEEQGSGNGE